MLISPQVRTAADCIIINWIERITFRAEKCSVDAGQAFRVGIAEAMASSLGIVRV
jgi:hypothetical protein